MLQVVAGQLAARTRKEPVRQPDEGSPRIMIIFFLTIPVMLVAVGIAVIPLLWAMKRQVASETRTTIARGAQGSFLLRRKAVMPQVANAADPSTDITDMAA